MGAFMLEKFRTIRLPLFGLVALAAVSLVVLGAYAIWVIKSEGLDAKIELTMSEAVTAKSLVKAFADQVEKGEIDLPTAQARAKAALRSFRYSNGGYLFIYTPDGTAIVHGFKPEREGKNFWAETDASGYAVLPDLVKIAQNGGGHIFHSFQKPGSLEMTPKVSSAVIFEPWQWVIGTGVYLDDIQSDFWRNVTVFGGLLVGMLLVMGAAAFWLARSIANPIQELASVTHKVGRGEYALEVPALQRRDEIGVLAVAVDSLKVEAQAAESLRKEQERIKQEAEQQRTQSMLSLANHFESSVVTVVKTISNGAIYSSDVSKSLVNVVDTVVSHSAEAASAARNVDGNIQSISSATEELADSINEISKQVKYSTEVSSSVVEKTTQTDVIMQELVGAVQKISGVVDLINNIAGQTNLLALNATIEAARAGDAGKGFSVVANEVKQLALQTSRATGEIIQQIDAVKSATGRSSESMRDVLEVINSVREVSTFIASAVERQSAATREIHNTLNGAAEGARAVSEFIDTMAGTISQMGGEADNVAKLSSTLGTEVGVLNQEVGSFLRTVRTTG